ncbi:MAG: hypothetical protein JSS00_15140 [Proteobacteria bacterium]|nr:hypothetical protein [Pseudomonadota bacterium]
MIGAGTNEYEPYPTEMANYFYSLLFCDIPENFWGWVESPAKPVFDPTFSERAIRAIAEDKDGESRIRALAYRRLRLEGCAVPQRLLLGVVVETPLPRGLDTLAAYADGRIRYIHGSGKEVAVEKDVASMRGPRKALLSGAQDVVDELTPLQELRAPPPKAPNVRVTSVASDGLYVGEANLEELTRDPLGGPILRATSDLMTAVIEYAKANAPR